ncbi:heat shock protein Hsp18 [Defluviitalea phaphyphila]|uniref:heat shock protein Hsp18 n=1 Tax=Defluviitalea phaphyphila TaxID=1473580 RepID=UPI000730029B|nr:heat shock protein Hsp18 [Defluviitalea phaphyphila]
MFDMMPFRRNSFNRKDDFFAPFFQHFFDDDFFPMMSSMNGNFRVDLKETDDNYIVEADLPGIQKENIDIDYTNNYLTINAKRNEEIIEDKKENYVRRERHYGEFRRSFYIDNVDENNIDASFKNGVLKIVLPKLNKGKTNRRKIDIR